MTVLSIQPARGKQQAAILSKQLAHFAGSRRGAAAAAVVLLAGGGYAYIQEQKQKARQRYALPDHHSVRFTTELLKFVAGHVCASLTT